MYLKQFGGRMKEIEEKELENISGGATSPWLYFGIGAVLVFIIGVFDGFTRPLECNK